MKFIRVCVLLFSLALPSLACAVSLPSNPQPPIPTFTPSPAEASAFEQSFTDAVSQSAQTGNFSVTVNQQQFSSWLALRAPSYAAQQGYTWPLKEVQAGLNNGKITVYGVIVQQNVPETPGQVIFTPTIDGSGSLAVNVESGQFGVVGVPTDVLQNLNITIKNALTTELAQIQGRYKLNTLTIANGSMTVAGQIVQ